MVFQNNLLMGAGGQPTGYDIDYSCRFDSDTPAYLSKTFGTPTSDKIWTFSFWAKLCKTDSGGYSIFIGAGDFNGNYNALSMAGAIPDIKWEDYQSSAWKTQLRSDAKYRDPSAWYHIVYSYDSTPSTPSASSIKIFVNGSQVTSFSSTNYPSQNQASIINTAVANWIGGIPTNGSGLYFDGYLAEVVFVDGTALDADSFGETNSDTGQWIPKKISGLTFGDNGFHLDFADSSALGNDVSGNNNDFTSSGLAAADQMTDSPTDNYCTLNPLTGNASITYSEGNLSPGRDGSSFQTYFGTQALPSTGKWYWEITAIGGTAPIGTGAGWDGTVGIGTRDADDNPQGESTNWVWGNAQTTAAGSKYNGSTTTLVPASSLTNNSIVMTAVDMDNSKIWWGVDNSWMGTASGDNDGDPAAGSNPAFDNLSGELFPLGNRQDDYEIYNFGQQSFAHTPPTGFEALSTANLDDPTIVDPSAYFQNTLYTGNGSTQSIDQGGNSTFEPDFVWIKNRSAADNHQLFDSARGVTKVLISNDTDAEATDADTLTAFDSDGFSLGDDDKVNTNTESYVAWQWLGANGTATNETGDITSTVCANTTSGFSVLTYTGNGSASQTIGHGLGAVPQWIFTKRRDSAGNWSVYNSTVGINKYMILDLTNAAATNTEHYTATPTTSVYTIGVGGDINANTGTFVAYCFTEIDGYSKFGSYTGNGSTNGPFVWCGFSPAWVVIKETSGAADWYMVNSASQTYNGGTQPFLRANLANAEADDAGGGDLGLIQLFSNGFKLVDDGVSDNENGATYVFMAFADTPFKTALAR